MKEKYKTMQFDPIDKNWTMRHVIKLSLENHGKGKPGDGNKGTLEVSEIYKSSKHIRVIKGKPGAGKTTLMRTISRDWSFGTIKEFSKKILILVTIRNLQDYSEEKIIKQSCSSLDSEKCKYLLQCLDFGRGKGFIFLLDGLDEYKDKDTNAPSYIENILSEITLKEATIIATSRYSAYLLNKITNDNTCYFEIKGFLRNEVFGYFQKRFSRDKYGEVEKYLKDNPNMVKLCYIPLHCAIMANILFEEHEKDDPPKTETKFFEMHTRCRIIRSVRRQGNSHFKLLTLDKLEGKNRNLFNGICELAYHATMENTQSLDEMELEKLELKFDSFHSHQANINGGLGLLVITPDITREGLPNNTYSFTHLAVQEFCAAFHIAKLPQKDITEIIEDEKCCNRLNSAWKFICGLLDFTNNSNGALEVFRTLIEKYTNEEKKLLFKIQCAHETQKQEPCIVLYESLKEMKISCMTPPELSLFMDTMKILGSADTELPDLESINLGFNQIEDEGAKILSGALRKMPNLQVLNLRGNKIGDGGVKALSEVLESMKQLKHLILSENEIGVDGIKDLSGALKNMSHLQELYLGRNKIGVEGIRSLFGALESMTSLQILGLVYNEIGPKGFETVLEKTLGKVLKLKRLYLAHNGIGDQGAKALSEVLKSMKELEVLSLSENEIGVEGIKDLSGALKNMSQLQELYLGRNKIGVEGVRSLFGALKSMTSLQILRLGYNEIGPEGFETVPEKISGKVLKLKELDLDCNGIGDQGAKALSEVLKSMKKLEVLSLVGNKFGVDGIKDLSGALKNMSQLQDLYLGENKIGDEGVRFGFLGHEEIEAVSETISGKMLKLKRLNLDCNGIGDQGAKALSKVLKSMKKLEVLSLERNEIGVEGIKDLSGVLKNMDHLQVLNLGENKIGVEGVNSLLGALDSMTSLQILFLNGKCFSREEIRSRSWPNTPTLHT